VDMIPYFKSLSEELMRSRLSLSLASKSSQDFDISEDVSP